MAFDSISDSHRSGDRSAEQEHQAVDMHSMRSAASTSSLSMKINSSAPRSRSSSTLLGNINVARMVATAFKPGTNAIGPKMLGLKQVKVKGISKSLSDLDESIVLHYTYRRCSCKNNRHIFYH